MNRATPEQPANSPFDAETWALLPSYFEALPHPVRIHVWANPAASLGEREAVRLVAALGGAFSAIETAVFPRRANYPYYPVIGVFGQEDGVAVDYGVRLIGLPAGYQMTSLIAAIQAVALRGATLEPQTRIRLRNLADPVQIELLSAADDESGPLMAKTAFGLAVGHAQVQAFLIMADVFPEITTRYSARTLPYLVINGKVHVDGVVDEGELLRQIALAVA